MPSMLQDASQTPKNLVCPNCKRAFHTKFASETRHALERLCRQNAWCCHSCTSWHPSAMSPNYPHAQSRVTPLLNLNQLCVLQWNCDSLPTKIQDLADVLDRYRINVALIQEIKLGLGDPTIQIPGFDCRNWNGSCPSHHRGCGLMVYIYQGVQYSTILCNH